MCLVDNNIYLVDRQQTYTNEESSQTEYEWYYWESLNHLYKIWESRWENIGTNGGNYKWTPSDFTHIFHLTGGK